MNAPRSAAAPAAEGFRRDINGLRGWCVALVVAFHLGLRGAGGGFIGVDAFFVISGYLMTGIVWNGLEGGRFGYGRFIGDRIARIWPALAVMIILLLAVGAAALPPFDLERLADQALWALAFISNVYFLHHSGYNPSLSETGWLQHTWSLAVEWQFYVLYPLLLWAVMAAFRRWLPGAASPGVRRRALAAALALAVLVSFAAWAVQSRGDAEAAFFLLPTRAWELLAGGVVRLLATPRGRAAALAAWLGFAIFLGSALWLGARHVPPVAAGIFAALPVLGIALVLWSGDVANVLLRHAAVQALGRWSYSIYLWHWPLVVGLRVFAPELAPSWQGMLGMAAGAVLLGALSYRFVESVVHRPARRAAPAWRRVRLPFGQMAAAALLVVAVAATGGLAFRNGAKPDFYAGYAASTHALYFPGHCSNYMKPPEALVTCTIERGQGRRILVIGDSHAEHLYAWFVRHSDVSVDFLTMAECPPVPGFERVQPGFSCLAYAREAWARARSPAYDTVVVSALWATAGLDGAPYCHMEAGARCVATRGLEKQRLVLAAIGRALDETLAAGKQVVVLDGTPAAPVRVPERLAREIFWHGTPALAIDRRRFEASMAWIDPLFRSYVGRPGFTLFSLRDTLCGAKACRVYDDALHRPIYIDQSHFDPVWIAQQELFQRFVRR